MGRFAPVYTEEQRAAVRRAGVDDRMPPKAIVEAAAAGELYGLEPFTIPKSTVSDLVRRERAKRKGPRPPVAELDGTRAADDLRRRVLVMADGMIERAERKQRSGKLQPAEFETTSRAVLRIASQLEGKLTDRGKGDLHEGAESDQGAGDGDKEPGLFDRLASSGTVPNAQGNGRGEGLQQPSSPTQQQQPPIA